MLEGLTALAEAAAGVVTYNGKSFDVPLLETRFALHRMRTRLSTARTWTCCIQRAACGRM